MKTCAQGVVPPAGKDLQFPDLSNDGGRRSAAYVEHAAGDSSGAGGNDSCYAPSLSFLEGGRIRGRRYQTPHGTGSADGAAMVSLWYCSFFSDRRGNLRGSADQIPGFIPNCSFCCAYRHQRHALSASRAAWNTEPILCIVLIFAGHVTGRPAGFILMRPHEDLCPLRNVRRKESPND